jgi:hypothetical protein
MHVCPVCGSLMQGGIVETEQGPVCRLFCTRKGCIGSESIPMEAKG